MVCWCAVVISMLMPKVCFANEQPKQKHACPGIRLQIKKLQDYIIVLFKYNVESSACVLEYYSS